MTQKPETATIPQPKPDPILGNIRDLDPKAPVQSLHRLARTYGPIYRLTLPGGDVIFISSQELVDEISDEKRFEKGENQALENLREFAGDGLVTARGDEANWGKAHRILMPVFSPAAMRDMFDGMHDIADQLLTRWERFGEGAVIDVVDNMTRLTLDTIALCAMGYRFNSFYQNESHPFVGALTRALAEAVGRTARHPLQTQFMLPTRRRFAEDIRLMHQIADDLVAQRKTGVSGVVKKDLLSRMLEARDPVTGEGLSDENIRYQMVTFLAAGHETTSGLLSFALYFLVKHPDVLARAQAEVDQVLGTDASGALTLGTCYKYDVLGNLIQVVQGVQGRTFAYDALARLTAETTPEGGMTTYAYTTSGSGLCSGKAQDVCQKTDAGGITITYTYDAENRLTGKSYSNGDPAVTYFYDQTSYNGLTITNGKGRRTGMSDAAGQTAWSYDSEGHMLTEKRTIGTATKTTSYTYNINGSVNRITYPSGMALQHYYSTAGQLTQVSYGATSFASGAAYGPNGAVTSVVLGVSGGFNGITLSNVYNKRFQPVTMSAKHTNNDVPPGVAHGRIRN